MTPRPTSDRSRTIAPMGIRTASRELVAGSMLVILLSLLVSGPAAWLVGLVLVVAVVLGTLQLLGDGIASTVGPGVPVESLISPGLAAVAVFGALRLVPMGMAIVPALAAGAWLLSRALGTEVRLLGSDKGLSGADRTGVLAEALVIGFLAFIGHGDARPGRACRARSAHRRADRSAARGSRGRRRRHRLLPGLSRRVPAIQQRPRCRLVCPDERRRRGDRGRGPPRDGDPASPRPCAPRARVLPVGRGPQQRAVSLVAMGAGSGKRSSSPSSGSSSWPGASGSAADVRPRLSRDHLTADGPGATNLAPPMAPPAIRRHAHPTATPDARPCGLRASTDRKDLTS